jgi:hypothetical protein
MQKKKKKPEIATNFQDIAVNKDAVAAGEPLVPHD